MASPDPLSLSGKTDQYLKSTSVILSSAPNSPSSDSYFYPSTHMNKKINLSKPQSDLNDDKQIKQMTTNNAKAATKLNYKNIPLGSNTPVRQQGSLLTTLAVTES